MRMLTVLSSSLVPVPWLVKVGNTTNVTWTEFTFHCAQPTPSHTLIHTHSPIQIWQLYTRVTSCLSLHPRISPLQQTTFHVSHKHLDNYSMTAASMMGWTSQKTVFVCVRKREREIHNFCQMEHCFFGLYSVLSLFLWQELKAFILG